MASGFPSSGFFAGGSCSAERLTAAAHTTATVSTENIHLISGSSLQKRVYTTFARERATKTKGATVKAPSSAYWTTGSSGVGLGMHTRPFRIEPGLIDKFGVWMSPCTRP